MLRADGIDLEAAFLCLGQKLFISESFRKRRLQCRDTVLGDAGRQYIDFAKLIGNLVIGREVSPSTLCALLSELCYQGLALRCAGNRSLCQRSARCRETAAPSSLSCR